MEVLDFQMAGTCKKYVPVVIINTEFLCGIPSNVPNTESYYTGPALCENKKKTFNEQCMANDTILCHPEFGKYHRKSILTHVTVG